MSPTASPASESQALTWIRRLLGQSRQLRDPLDPAFRHAEGIAEGFSYAFSSARWPGSPADPTGAFSQEVAREEARRRAGQPALPLDPEDDPFDPQPVEGAPVAVPPQAEQAVRRRLEQILAKAGQGQSDPGWRLAYGVAQGFGTAVRSSDWPPFPDVPGSAFFELMNGVGGGAPHSPPPPPTAGDGLPAGMPAFRAMPTLIDEEAGSEPAPVSGPGRGTPTLIDPGAGSEPAPSAFNRAQRTMIEDEVDDDDAPRVITRSSSSNYPRPTTRSSAQVRPPARPSPATDSSSRGDSSGSSGAAAPLGSSRSSAGNPRPPAGEGPATRSLKRPRGSLRDALSGKEPPSRPARKSRPISQKPKASADDVEQIGSYRILERLGKGAMGQVFKGEGPGGEIAAIKVLHARFGKSRRVKARFLREAKSVERIQHPGVVRFIESGEQEGLGQYFAMEFVDGDGLHDLLRKRRGKPFELATATDYVLQICRGLQAAHEAGVIHRDLKPENVLVSKQGEVKITDFSLARRDQDSMLLTRPGQVMGTPHFMSPEQARGEDVDARADLYSLGGLAYVLLTGRFPFPLETVAEVISAHCEQPRPDPRDLNPDVPAALAQVVMRLMAIDRADRHQTVAALIEDLNQALGLASAEDEDDELTEGALPPGTRIREFEITGVLGAGGMGHVYRARDPNGAEVALKLLPPQPGRAPQERVRDVNRFLNEAKIAGRVDSRHVYGIQAYGVDEGQAFIAAELVAGTSLADLINREGMLPPKLIEKVARGISEALVAIHGAGFVHRDVTPANVILRGDFRNEPDAGVCLIDFGLAMPQSSSSKRTGAAWDDGSSSVLLKHRVGGEEQEEVIDEDALYLEELPGGTPAYMAPEVLEDASDVDGRTDLYGLGATLYHASAGVPPYAGQGIEGVLYQQKNRAPAPISQFNADFPEDLAELILQLLSASPTQRPRSAKLVLSKLALLGSGGVVTAAPPPRPSSSTNPAAPSLAQSQQVDAAKSDGSTTFMIGFVSGLLLGMALTFGLVALGIIGGG